jgi:hypothetical protein
MLDSLKTMPDATRWTITIIPNRDGYALRESSDNEASELLCSKVAEVITEALSDYLA